MTPTRPSPSASAGATPSPTPEPSAALVPVRLLIQDGPDARSAGFIAAIEQGYYESIGLEVTLSRVEPAAIASVGGSGAPGGAEPVFVVAWVPQVLRARDRGASDLVDIGQIAQRSGTLSMAWKDAEITSPADFRDHEVGVFGGGREIEVTAAAIDAGLHPGSDFTTADTAATAEAFLRGDVDAAQALIYDQYAQVLESTDPRTDAQYRPIDLDVINYNDLGTAMLQDAIFAPAWWLAGEGNEDIARRFLRATFQGWMRCRDDPTDCVQATLDYAAAAGGPGASPGAGASACAFPPRRSAPGIRRGCSTSSTRWSGRRRRGSASSTRRRGSTRSTC